MAGTHHRSRRNQAKQRTNRSNKQTEPPDKYKNTKILPGGNPILRKSHTEPIRENRHHETTVKKRKKMGMSRRTKHRLQ